VLALAPYLILPTCDFVNFVDFQPQVGITHFFNPSLEVVCCPSLRLIDGVVRRLRYLLFYVLLLNAAVLGQD